MTSVVEQDRPLGAPNPEAVRRTRARVSMGWILVGPALAAMVVLAFVPMLWVVKGTFSADGITAFRIFSRTQNFYQMLRNTGIWFFLCTVGALICGYAAAIALHNKRVRHAGIWRTIFLIPWITPTVVAATAWKWILSRDYGALNIILMDSDVVQKPVSWLTNLQLALPIVAMVQVWCTFPFVMVMIGAGLQSIDEERIEAARLDGANTLQVLRHILIPALKTTNFITILVIAVWALNSFVVVWVITAGGPAGSTNILPVEVYQSFISGNFARVNVVAFILLVLSVAIALTYALTTSREKSE